MYSGPAVFSGPQRRAAQPPDPVSPRLRGLDGIFANFPSQFPARPELAMRHRCYTFVASCHRVCAPRNSCGTSPFQAHGPANAPISWAGADKAATSDASVVIDPGHVISFA